MNLREAGIGEEGAFLVSAISRGDVATARVGRKVENVAVPAGREHDRVTRVGFDFSRDQATGNDSFGVTVDQHKVEHFGLGKHGHGLGGNLSAERLVSAEEKL